MTQKEISIRYISYGSENELPADFQQLIEEAKKALDMAYAPYSNFQVGAAIRLSNGEIVSGANQENAAYPSGLCAERTAMYYAGAHFPNEKMEALAVLARKKDTTALLPACPCGACRQAMLEYEQRQDSPISLIFRQEEYGFIVVDSVAATLPFKFDANALL